MSNQDKTPWPRLSADLPHRREIAVCQACGAEAVHAWQEHDEQDKPEPIAVFLCQVCAESIIEPHPRLYRRIEIGEPFPGAMPCCAGCVHLDGVTCGSPRLLRHGGPGLRMTFPTPGSVHIDGRDPKTGRRFGEWRKVYHGPVVCEGREVAAAANQAAEDAQEANQ